MVGALILTNSMGSTCAGAQMVSPIVMSPMPLIAIMLPAEASFTGTRCKPSNSYMETALALRGGGLRRVVVADRDFVIVAYRAALDAPDGDAAHELVVVDAAHEHLEGRVLVALRRGDVFDDGVEQRLQVHALHVRRIAGRAVAAGAEEHGGVELLIRAAEVHQQLEHLVHHLEDALVGPVDLVEQ